MLGIYVADTDALSDEKVFRDYMDKVDGTRREKVRQCRNVEDRKRSLLAGYLIQVGMRDWMGDGGGPREDAAPLSLAYTYGTDGKPFLKDYGGICFSISHSGKYVTVAFSDHDVGIDVQKHGKVRQGMADRFFAGEDKALMERLGEENAKENFYRIWTVKEAYMKLTGEGMRQGLDATVIEPDGEGLHGGKIRNGIIRNGIIRRKNGRTENAYFAIYDRLGEYRLEEYSLAVCSYHKIADICIKEVAIG